MTAVSPHPAPTIDSRLTRAQKLARAIRVASVFPLTAPIGLVLGYLYLDAVGQLDERPYDHSGTVVTLYEDLFISLLLAGVAFWIAR